MKSSQKLYLVKLTLTAFIIYEPKIILGCVLIKQLQRIFQAPQTSCVHRILITAHRRTKQWLKILC